MGWQVKQKHSIIFYVTGFGNSRGNENPFLMTLGILWFRYHNHLAQKFKEQNPNWTDERVSTVSAFCSMV